MKGRRVSRRGFFKATFAAAGATMAATPFAVVGQAKKSDPIRVDPALRGLDEFFADFFQKHKPPGMGVAVTAASNLVYARGFGLADREASTPVTPTSLFRIASVSKPLTSTAVMQLVEHGQLKLDDPVRKYVTTEPFLVQGRAHDPRWEKVTIWQCLHHTGGWDRDKSLDPIGPDGNRRIGEEMKIATPVPVPDFIRYMLGQPLDFDPGSVHAYSNFGYCRLARVIEAVSGARYDEYVTKEVLHPLQITRMRQAKNLLEDRAEGEVKHYDSQNRTAPAVAGPHRGEPAPLPYGVTLVESQDSAGGWLASAVDLVKFGTAFDNPLRSRLLKPASIEAMLLPPPGTAGHEPNGQPKESYYACGWVVRPVARSKLGGTKWHVGRLAGTSTVLVCRHDAINWAVLFNGETNPDGKEFAGEMDAVIHPAIDNVRTWPRVDLFPRLLKS